MKTITNITCPAFACFAFSPDVHAVCQQGCGATDNTFLGDDALISNTTGTDNTAVDFNALFSNTTDSGNTATGSNALKDNRAQRSLDVPARSAGTRARGGRVSWQTR